MSKDRVCPSVLFITQCQHCNFYISICHSDKFKTFFVVYSSSLSLNVCVIDITLSDFDLKGPSKFDHSRKRKHNLDYTKFMSQETDNKKAD